MISRALIRAITAQYVQAFDGVHGLPHWARVLENGLQLAPHTGANVAIVQLFAVFHDSRRINEGFDRGHGRRGAELAASLRKVLYDLPDNDFNLLFEACVYHTDGLTEGDATLQTCWDADRLDIGRAGIKPHPRYLCTQAAQDPHLIRWADERSRQGFVPAIVSNEWGLLCH